MLTENELLAYVGKPLSGVPTFVLNMARIIKKGGIYTMDLRPNRLNFVVDTHGVVTRAYYG